MALSVALDIDPGIDDALAVALAIRSPEITVEMVSTVAGNGPIHMTTANALRVLDVLGHGHLPVHAGAVAPIAREFHGALDYHGHDAMAGLPLPEPESKVQDQPATEALYAFAASDPGNRVIVATGPLTNIALAFQQYPEMPGMLRELVIMGGAFGLTRYGTGNTTPYAEFNIWQDPEAAAIVFASPARMTIVGLDVTNDPETGLNREDLVRLQASHSSAARLSADITAFALERHDVCALHDPLALAAALDRSLFEFKRGRLTVHTSDDEMGGRTMLHAESSTAMRTRMPAVAAAVDGERFKEMFITRVTGE